MGCIMFNILKLADILSDIMKENNIYTTELTPYTLTFYYNGKQKTIGNICLTKGIIGNPDNCNIGGNNE